jgi:hypothetical protein
VLPNGGVDESPALIAEWSSGHWPPTDESRTSFLCFFLLKKIYLVIVPARPMKRVPPLKLFYFLFKQTRQKTF